MSLILDAMGIVPVQYGISVLRRVSCVNAAEGGTPVLHSDSDPFGVIIRVTGPPHFEPQHSLSLSPSLST